MTIDELNKQTEYNATEYVNDSAPDIDAEHLNKNEQKLKETVQQANNIIDTLKALISDVQTESSSTVPSSSLVYQMQQQIDSISQGGVSGDYIKKSDISNVQVNDQNKVPSSALAYSMQQQINETNSNLASEFTAADLLAETTAVSSESDSIKFTISDLSNYKAVLLYAINNGDYLSPAFIPLSLFKNKNKYFTNYNHSGTFVTAWCKYISDSQIYLARWTGSGGTGAKLYGLK